MIGRYLAVSYYVAFENSKSHFNVASDSEEEFIAITSLVIQALSILQGVALIHKPSKEYLCRRLSIEVSQKVMESYLF